MVHFLVQPSLNPIILSKLGLLTTYHAAIKIGKFHGIICPTTPKVFVKMVIGSGCIKLSA